jgi:hypothetical protein
MEACRIIIFYHFQPWLFRGYGLLRPPRCDDTVSTLMMSGCWRGRMLRKDPVCSLAEAGLGMVG